MLSLPNYKPVSVRNEVDRYGFSTLLANTLSLNHAPRSFCNWLHGWVWWDPEIADELGCSNLPFNVPIVVSKHSEQLLLNSLGYKNVHSGGLPFLYTEFSGVNRKKNSLLAFIPHSSESVSVSNVYDENYLNYLESIKKSFSEVCVCVHWFDSSNKVLLENMNSRGLSYVFGARVDDGNSLLRMRMLLDYFDFITTPIFGSHILYAAYAGCKVSMCGPLLEYKSSDFKQEEGISLKHIEKLIKSGSVEWLKVKFPFIFVDHPTDASTNLAWAKAEIGSENKLSSKELINILGWSVEGQIKGYISGLSRRIVRYKRS
ncbi:hypothetical protein HOO14_05380 [bacterium]|nr:hypothetical protein [bacterium]